MTSDRHFPGPASSLVATARFAASPYRYFDECARRYGDPFSLPVLGGELVVTGDPELVRALYGLGPDASGGLLGHLIPEILGAESVLVMSGARHQTERKLLMPLFHNEHIAGHGGAIRAITRRRLGAHAPGSRVRMYELFRAITLDVILCVLFGEDAPSFTAEMHRAVVGLTESAPPPFVFFRALRRRFLGLLPWDRVERRLARLDRHYYDEIARRRSGGDGDRRDMLGLLLSLRYDDGAPLCDRAVRDELMSLVMAGHETMAVTLAWASYWLYRHDAVRERLREEVAAGGVDRATPEEIARLPYLDAVAKEVLRIYPIQPIVIRHLLEPVEFAGKQLPRGTFIGAATTMVHADPAIYPDPERFSPERFIGRTYTPFEYFPFGGGARRCLGASFALWEMKIILATLVTEFRLELASTRPLTPVRRSTVTGPRGGVEMILHGRA